MPPISVQWESQKTSKTEISSYLILESITKLNVVLLNKGTFNKGSSNPIIDLTFVNPSLARTSTWKVLNILTQSDHNAIEFIIGNKKKLTKRVPTAQKQVWKTRPSIVK